MSTISSLALRRLTKRPSTGRSQLPPGLPTTRIQHPPNAISHSLFARRHKSEFLMTAEHQHSADHVHDAGCEAKRSRLTASFAMPLRPLRWLVVGCLGLAVVGMALPFSPIPPCPMLTITGVPCPLCGMTRSARSLLHLDLSASLRYQPFGLAAFMCGVIILALWAIPRTRAVSVVRIPVAVVIAVVAVSWIWNIAFNPTFA